eukprot:1161733-Pelagomonas_calceolata.AAC.2
MSRLSAAAMHVETVLYAFLLQILGVLESRWHSVLAAHFESRLLPDKPGVQGREAAGAQAVHVLLSGAQVLGVLLNTRCKISHVLLSSKCASCACAPELASLKAVRLLVYKLCECFWA